MKNVRWMTLGVVALTASLAFVGCTKKEEEMPPVVEAPAPVEEAPAPAAEPATDASAAATTATTDATAK